MAQKPLVVRSSAIPSSLSLAIIAFLACLAVGTFIAGSMAMLYGILVRLLGGVL